MDCLGLAWSDICLIWQEVGGSNELEKSGARQDWEVVEVLTSVRETIPKQQSRTEVGRYGKSSLKRSSSALCVSPGRRCWNSGWPFPTLFPSPKYHIV